MVFNFDTWFLIFAEGFILETGNHVTIGRVTRNLFFFGVKFVTQNVVHEITSDQVIKLFFLFQRHARYACAYCITLHIHLRFCNQRDYFENTMQLSNNTPKQLGFLNWFKNIVIFWPWKQGILIVSDESRNNSSATESAVKIRNKLFQFLMEKDNY